MSPPNAAGSPNSPSNIVSLRPAGKLKDLYELGEIPPNTRLFAASTTAIGLCVIERA